MQIIIARFEGDIAVCEKPDRTIINIPREKLPIGTRESDVLEMEGEAIYLNIEETTRRKTAIEDKMRRLRRKK